MSLRSFLRRRRSVPIHPRVGLFGLLGAGNVGNDGSLEAVLAYLRAEHPGALLGCMCAGPEQIRARYGIPSKPMHWYPSYARESASVAAVPRKLLGKVFDAFRTLSWVRRFDVVIVPGTGVLETTLPLRPWGFPYALFLLCATSRLTRTKIALLSVGADPIPRPLTRWLIAHAAKLADYRSYRDAHSKNAMQAMGVETSGDEVFADLAFALPTPPAASESPGAVGVGVMAWRGGNDDRRQAEVIGARYEATMKQFVRWLVDNGHRVRLFTGDQVDEVIVREIMADLREHRPDLAQSQLRTGSAASLEELMQQMTAVDTVVATRYHNVLCSLKLTKPTLSISYSAKSDALMTEMGLAEFCHSARCPEVQRLIEQFQTLDSQRTSWQPTMVERNRAYQRRLDQQFSVLSDLLCPASIAQRRSGTGSAHEDLSGPDRQN